ncbi:MAG: hypothetical protein COT21_00560 [Hadesarchaea archaeon CG08_land_8_20_14_0_20_51_8]|nr:MAG: hypothetical protein COT21_00560 [Hadesarchaea archaeon CG08_land_8_20_14_0_20_51_8]
MRWAGRQPINARLEIVGAAIEVAEKYTITNQSKKQLAINFVSTVALLAVLSLISSYFLNVVAIGIDRYSVSVGPFLEEAFKGGAIFLFSLMILLSYPRLKKTLNSKRYWLLLGALVGLGIALWEAFVQYSPGLHRVVPSLNHICWTAMVGGGIWLYMQAGHKWKLERLILPYMAAVISHIFWNYYVYLNERIGSQEPMFAGIAWVIILATLFAIWKTE